MESFCEYTYRNKHVIYRDLQRIENPDDAYLVGHLAFDGSFESRNRIISIDTTSLFLLDFWKDKYCPTSTIYLHEPRSSKKVNAKNRIGRLSFPRPMSAKMGKFGLLNYKQDRTLSGIPDRFFSYYMIGAIDAEGWFTIRHRKDCRTPRLNFGIGTSANKLIEGIQRNLELLGFSSSIYAKESIVSLQIHNVKVCVEFVKWLYADLPSIYNTKKKSVVDTYLKEHYK